MMMKVTCGIYLYHATMGKILICHATHARWNMWSIPKGLREGESDLYGVAVRELLEETGIDVQTLHVVKSQQLPPVKYVKQNKTLESFLIVTDSNLEEHKFRSNIVEGKGVSEIDQWKWVSLEEAKKWLHESQVKQLDLIATTVNQL